MDKIDRRVKRHKSHQWTTFIRNEIQSRMDAARAEVVATVERLDRENRAVAELTKRVSALESEMADVRRACESMERCWTALMANGDTQ